MTSLMVQPLPVSTFGTWLSTSPMMTVSRTSELGHASGPGPGVSATTVNEPDSSADTLPALSVARYLNVWAPTESTVTGAVYAVHAPPASASSTEPTPEPVSSAETVTSAASTYSQFEFCVPETTADTDGGVVSTLPATTVNVSVPSADTLPAWSVARYETV